MNIDYTFHSHTYRCGHASKDIDSYVSIAVSRGLKIYGVSDHVFLPGVIEKYTRGDYSLLDEYIAKYQEVKKQYLNQIEMYLGFECEYSDIFIDYYKNLLKNRGFDYLICGQHCGFDQNKNIYMYYDGEEGAIRYKDDLIKAMQSGLFLYIAHPDIYFLFATEVTPFLKRITKEIIDAAIKYDAVLEVNMHGLTREHHHDGKTYIDYPCEYFWKEVSKTNIKVVVGGDYHYPEEIGDPQIKEKLDDLITKCHLKFTDIRQVYKDYRDRILLK